MLNEQKASPIGAEESGVTDTQTSRVFRNSLGKWPKIMAHVVLGYPTLEESIQIAVTMAECGVSYLELQFPFSDPIADGPTIMHANECALAQRVTTDKCFQAAAQIEQKVDIPLYFMSYINKLLCYQNGVQSFLQMARNAGFSGGIVPDIPPEEHAENYWDGMKALSLQPIAIVSPVTDEKRLSLLAEVGGSEFVYCVSVTGVTGARNKLPEGLHQYIDRVRAQFKRPVALGFGISSKEHVEAISQTVDIAIVGSATIDVIDKAAPQDRLSAVADFITSLVRPD